MSLHGIGNLVESPPTPFHGLDGTQFVVRIGMHFLVQAEYAPEDSPSGLWRTLGKRVG